MSRFIELTFYEHNKTFPEKSGTSGKKFLLNTDDIGSVIPYKYSTKIRYKYTGECVEVSESYTIIFGKLKNTTAQH